MVLDIRRGGGLLIRCKAGRSRPTAISTRAIHAGLSTGPRGRTRDSGYPPRTRNPLAIRGHVHSPHRRAEAEIPLPRFLGVDLHHLDPTAPPGLGVHVHHSSRSVDNRIAAATDGGGKVDGRFRPFWDIARGPERSLRIVGADTLGRDGDSTGLLLAFEYEDVWRSAARNACGYREGLEIGRNFVLLGQCDLAFGPLNHFKGARAEASR